MSDKHPDIVFIGSCLEFNEKKDNNYEQFKNHKNPTHLPSFLLDMKLETQLILIILWYIVLLFY